MAIQAPYKGRDEAPAQADKADATPADKPDTHVDQLADEVSQADKRVIAPTDEPEAAENKEELDEPDDAEEESKEAPDPGSILRHADYTRKVMAVADEKRAVAAREAAMQARYGVYEQVDAILASNPGLAKTHTVEQLVQMVQSPETAAQPTSIPPEARRELDALRREMAETKESLFVDRVESAVKRVARQYGLKRAQVEQLVKAAVEDDLIVIGLAPEKINRRLTMLARGMTYGKAEAKGQTKFVEKVKERQKAASGGTTATPTTSEATRPKTRGWGPLIAAHQKRSSGG